MGPEVLACGAVRADVVDTAWDDDADRAGHGPDCAHCRRAREAATARWDLVRSDLARPSEPPESIARAVFARVRSAQVGGQVPLPSNGPGRTLMSTAALADLARRATRAVDGVYSVDAVEVTSDTEGTLAVSVELQADLARRLSLPGVARSVRHAVGGAVTPASGLAVTSVDVTFH